MLRMKTCRACARTEELIFVLTIVYLRLHNIAISIAWKQAHHVLYQMQSFLHGDDLAAL